MKFYLNEVEVKVLNGATFSIQKDETLDSGKIELVLMEDKTPIKPMTDLTIIDDETYNFVVLSDTVEIASKKPECYKHTLQFVQNTKKFSKIQVRNTQFAQPAKNSLKCGCNATFLNKAGYETGYMQKLVLGAGEGNLKNEYSYSMEVSQRHKVKGAHFKIEAFWYKYQSQSQSGTEKHYQETMQDTCPKLRIYFSVYKDDVFQYEQSAEYSNGDIYYLLKLSNGVYTIKNIKVALLSDTSKYSEYDLFVVNISLVADVYYYSLYDVLDTLRKQIALREGEFESIDAPAITYESEIDSSNITNYKYVIKNSNPFECYVYVKTWQNGEDEPFNYTNVGEVAAYNSYIDSELYKQTRFHIKTYLIKKDDSSLISGIKEDYKFMPPIPYEYKLYLSVFGKDVVGKYELIQKDQFMSNNDYQNPISCWHYIEDNFLYDLSSYTFNADMSKVENDIFTLYGYCYLDLKEPNIQLSSEYIASSGVYELKAKITNTLNAVKPVKIYWYSEGTLAFEGRYLEDGKEYKLDEGATISLGTYGTGSGGKVYARCEYEELASFYGSSSWTSGGVTAPDITFKKVLDNQYDIVIKQLCEPYETLYVRYKVGDDEWGEWDSLKDTYIYTIHYVNQSIYNKTVYVEAYSEVEGKQSLTTSASQLVLHDVINAPKISYNMINDYTGTITIENQATQSDAVIYYKVVKNGDDPIDYSLYKDSFQIQADEGSDDVYQILAYVHSTIGEGNSEVVIYKTTLYGTKRLVRPTINIRNEYVASSGGYNIYVSFTNNNKIESDVNWYSTGTFPYSSKVVSSLGAGKTSEEYLLGLSTTSTDKGVVYANTSIEGYKSDTISEEWTNAGPVYYTLTIKRVGVGLSETTTEEIVSGKVINPNDYIKDYSGYKYSSITPTTKFTMLQDETITINYVVGGELSEPVITKYSEDSSSITMKVTNNNNDVVSFIYVINPSDIPTTADEIINATNKYTLASISENGGYKTDDITVVSGEEYVDIYGVFISTSHSTTYDPSGVADKRLYKSATLKEPTFTYVSSDSSHFVTNVYNPNDVSATLVLDNQARTTLGAGDTYKYTGSFSSTNERKVTAQLINASGYMDSDTAITYYYKVLNAPTITLNEKTSSYVKYDVTNNNECACKYESKWLSKNETRTYTQYWNGSDSITTSGYFITLWEQTSSSVSKTFPKIWTLTVKYTGVGLSKEDTYDLAMGVTVNPNDYIKDISGYKYSSISPTNSFTLNSDATITINYLVGGKLDSPVFSEYSQDADDVTFKVTNTNSDAVTLYYVINPSEIPTSAEDIINATDHYIISNISTSAKDTFPWGGDASITLYGVFGSTSHSTTYDDSDVGSITLYKREITISDPTINYSSYGTYSKQITITTNDSHSGAVTKYYYTVNGKGTIEWNTYSGSFVLSAGEGEINTYKIYAKTIYNGYESSVVSEEFTIEGKNPTYTLTIKYYKGGIQYSSTTAQIIKNSTVLISDYKIEISGYKLDSSKPSSDFTMTSNLTLNMYYIVDTIYDWYFYNTVIWDNSFTEKNGDYTLKLTLKSSKMIGDYSSQAVYSVYDETQGKQLDDETRSVYITNSTSETYTLTGDATHNNASEVIENRGSN